VTPAHEAFEELLPKYGFIIEEKRHGWRMKSFRHPALDSTLENGRQEEFNNRNS
jgi:hypothetical protein